MKKAGDYVFNFSSRLIVELSDVLNKIHKRSYSINYWNTLLMPSIFSFVQACYERHLHLQKFLIENKLKNGDIVVFLGAGDISSKARIFVEKTLN